MALSPGVRPLIDALLQKIAALERENAELRRRLGIDSSNSSKPNLRRRQNLRDPALRALNRKKQAINTLEEVLGHANIFKRLVIFPNRRSFQKLSHFQHNQHAAIP